MAAKVKIGPKVMRIAANSEHWERLTVLACTKDILSDLALNVLDEIIGYISVTNQSDIGCVYFDWSAADMSMNILK